MSINPPLARHPVSLSLHPQHSATRSRIERFIHQRFAQVHGADVQDFLPTLVSCNGTDGELMAAAGFQLANEGPLFLEAYLDRPIEHILTALPGTPPTRNQIVEVGNLATARPGRTRHLVIALAAWFDRRQLQWAVLTLTPTLINSFRRLGLEVHPLAPARQERLCSSRSNWGHYYELQPQVVAVSVPASAELLRRAAMSQALSATPDLQPASGGPRHA